MENFSRQNLKTRFSLSLKTPSYLQDHGIGGKAVFPAVESLVTLARAVKDYDPQAFVHSLADAVFSRLFVLAPDTDEQPIYIELERSGSRIKAILATPVKTKNGAMSRRLEHARVTFVQEFQAKDFSNDCRNVRRHDKECIQVPAAAIYRELVPFGPAYRNIQGDLSVSPSGAWAEVSGGAPSRDFLLGSPFTMDAAMHAACVWGQRFADTVAFPVGIDERLIFIPTKAGEMYSAQIFPVSVAQNLLVFNACIFNQDGILCEAIKGLRMRDVTGGGVRPPGWIKEGAWKKI